VYEEQSTPEATVENLAVAAAMSKLDALEEAPLEEHATIFEGVRADLRAALDAD
jgi:hypothetical protein